MEREKVQISLLNKDFIVFIRLDNVKCINKKYIINQKLK